MILVERERKIRKSSQNAKSHEQQQKRKTISHFFLPATLHVLSHFFKGNLSSFLLEASNTFFIEVIVCLGILLQFRWILRIDNFENLFSFCWEGGGSKKRERYFSVSGYRRRDVFGCDMDISSKKNDCYL